MNTYPTQEDAESTLKGWKRLGKGVFSKGDKRAYVSHFCDLVNTAKTGRPPSERTKEGWIVSYWPIEKTQGRVSREELGGKAWM